MQNVLEIKTLVSNIEFLNSILLLLKLHPVSKSNFLTHWPKGPVDKRIPYLSQAIQYDFSICY